MKIFNFRNLVIGAVFCAGYITCQVMNMPEREELVFLREANSFKYELLEAEESALFTAYDILKENEIEDERVKSFFQDMEIVDSLFMTEL